METIDLYSLSLTELLDIQKEIPKAIEKVQKEEKAALRKKMEELAAESGFKLDDVVSASPQGLKKRTVKPKYQNPDKPEQTWTGRGRKPKWVEHHLDQGKTIEQLLIS